MKRAFLTGGTGFVGATLARTLLTEGWEVRALLRPSSDPRNLDGLPLERVVGEIGEPQVEHALRGCDALFHVAAHYSLWRADVAALYRSNVLDVREILAAAQRSGVERVVYTSSVAAIGVKPQGSADETFQSPPEQLIGAYKRSKYLGEIEARGAAERGQDVVIVNPSTPIGAWDRKPTPTGAILVRFLRGKMPALIETGLNFLDVADCARGHLLAYERGVRGERYILGGENTALRDLLNRAGARFGMRAPRFVVPSWIPLAAAYIDEGILTRFGKRPSVPIDGVRMSGESMFYSCEKAQTKLGFTARPIDDALTAAVEWFLENGYLPERTSRRSS